MTMPVEGVAAWRASIERHHAIRAPNPIDPAVGGSAVSPWQALMTQAAIARGETPSTNPRASDTGWQPRIEQAPPPAREIPPGVKDRPDRVETAGLQPSAADQKPGLFEAGEFSLADVIDTINPLQHIPIVSTIYRELTGDQIGHGARIAGGVLFMGPVGALAAMANVLVQESSGKDVGEHALAMFKDDPAVSATAGASEQNKIASASERNQIAGGSDEQALAELLPPGALPIPGRSVDFAAAARPAAFAGSPASAPPIAPLAAAGDDLPPPPPPAKPLARSDWKGFYAPMDDSPAAPPASPQPVSGPRAQRALQPDPMAALAAKRTPGSVAAAVASANRLPRELPPDAGAIASEGGWFSDVMLDALGKYQNAQRLRQPAPPEASLDKTPGGGVNIVN